MAVKVTDAPAQILVDDAAILTDGVTELVVTVMALDVAVGVVVHDALLVITTVTLSPLFKVVVVKVDEVAAGTFVPFTCHW